MRGVQTQNLQCEFWFGNFFYGKCCSSKTISARRSADGYKSPQRDALRFIFCRRRRRLFVAFSERAFFEGVPVWEVWEVLVQKLYLGVKNMCKKFREHPTVGLDLCRDNILTTPPNRAMDSPMVEWCYRIYSMVKTTWTSWMGFGPVEWSGWGLVVIPFGKWSSGKKIVHFRWILPEKSVLTVFTL